MKLFLSIVRVASFSSVLVIGGCSDSTPGTVREENRTQMDEMSKRMSNTKGESRPSASGGSQDDPVKKMMMKGNRPAPK